MAEPIRVEVQAGPSVVVTIPTISKRDLVKIMGSFFGREIPEAVKNIEHVMESAKDLTLVLTTKR